MADRIGQASRLAERARRLAADGDLPAATEAQRAAVDLMRGQLDEFASTEGMFPDEERDVAHPLSDYLGRLGGYLRRADRLTDAADAYTRGAEIERRYRLPDSYNLTNSIVLQILIDPTQLPRLRDRIDEAAAVVQAQVERSRRDEWWACADLGLLSLLAGRSIDAQRAYESFRNTGARRTDYDSVLDVLRGLRARLQPSAPEVADSIGSAIAFLESSR
jgi:hypothetical protein